MTETQIAMYSDRKLTELQGLSLIKALLEFARTPLEFSLKCAEEYEDIVSLSIGSAKFYLFNHPSLIEEVLSKQNQNSIKDYSYRVLQDVFGNGLLLSHGDTWKYHRRLMQSAFNSDRLMGYAVRVVTETDLMLENWRSKQSCDVHREMSCLTAKIIIRAMFGVDATETAEEITQAVDKVMQQYCDRAETFYLLPSWLPTRTNWQAGRAKKRLNEIIYGIVERRQHTEDDVLSTMLNATDEAGNRLSTKQLRDEVMTLLLAGYDTTANALTWTLMLLAQNPKAEAKLIAELNSVLTDRLPTIDDIPHLPYTEMVLKESMRLYPPAWILGRELIRDCNIGGYNFSRGTVIYFSQWAVHRSARFFNDPEKFNPDRWADNLEQRLPRCTYFPFGAGARVCIGKVFSMMEATLILAMVMQRFHLTLVSKCAIELLPSFTLRPKQGVEMRIISRDAKRVL